MDIPYLLNSNPSSDDTFFSYLTVEQKCNLEFLEYACKRLFESHLTIVDIKGTHYVIGLQIAKLIKNETSNLYRSLKRMGFDILRATPDQVRYINALKLPLISVSHSITFIKLKEILTYLNQRNIEFFM